MQKIIVELFYFLVLMATLIFKNQIILYSGTILFFLIYFIYSIVATKKEKKSFLNWMAFLNKSVTHFCHALFCDTVFCYL